MFSEARLGDRTLQGYADEDKLKILATYVLWYETVL